MSLLKYFGSTVARKFLVGLSGLLLVAFVCVHLGGNLTMLFGPVPFNTYTHHLESLGPLLWLAEAGLALIFLVHAILAIRVQLEKRQARPDRYAVSASRGEPSRQTIASRSMIITGIVLAVYLPIHIWMFKFNAGQVSPTVVENGREVRDLYAVVLAAFKHPAIAWGYALVMTLFGFHLRHGFWSAFQSLGAMNPKWLPVSYSVGFLVALLLAGGFIVLPLWMCYVA